jgi:hypothetical protein
MGVLGLAILAVSGVFGDEQPAKGRKGLPPYWSKLGLSDEQKAKAVKIQDHFGKQIASLQEQIKTMQKQEKGALQQILTQAQRDRLKEIVSEKVGATDVTADTKDAATTKDVTAKDATAKDDKKAAEKK